MTVYFIRCLIESKDPSLFSLGLFTDCSKTFRKIYSISIRTGYFWDDRLFSISVAGIITEIESKTNETKRCSKETGWYSSINLFSHNLYNFYAALFTIGAYKCYKGNRKSPQMTGSTLTNDRKPLQIIGTIPLITRNPRNDRRFAELE